MPPLSKKIKLITKPDASNVVSELELFQNEIRKIKGLPETVVIEDNAIDVKNEHDYRLQGDPMIESQPNIDGENIKKYIREQIRASERRIHQRFDILEQKLNTLFERHLQQPIDEEEEEEEVIEEEHLVEWIEQDSLQQKIDTNDLDCRIFPIADESTFDWFFDKLKDEEYRTSLIQRRCQLTRNVSTKSFNVSVKEFIRLHFDLPVCVKYSVSGFGAHGVRKKKLDANSLTIFIFECFNQSFPGFHSFQEVSKSIVQFWGRAPDTFNKANERANKRDNNESM